MSTPSKNDDSQSDNPPEIDSDMEPLITSPTDILDLDQDQPVDLDLFDALADIGAQELGEATGEVVTGETGAVIEQELLEEHSIVYPTEILVSEMNQYLIDNNYNAWTAEVLSKSIVDLTKETSELMNMFNDSKFINQLRATNPLIWQVLTNESFETPWLIPISSYFKKVYDNKLVELEPKNQKETSEITVNNKKYKGLGAEFMMETDLWSPRYEKSDFQLLQPWVESRNIYTAEIPETSYQEWAEIAPNEIELQTYGVPIARLTSDKRIELRQAYGEINKTINIYPNNDKRLFIPAQKTAHMVVLNGEEVPIYGLIALSPKNSLLDAVHNKGQVILYDDQLNPTEEEPLQALYKRLEAYVPTHDNITTMYSNIIQQMGSLWEFARLLDKFQFRFAFLPTNVQMSLVLQIQEKIQKSREYYETRDALLKEEIQQYLTSLNHAPTEYLELMTSSVLRDNYGKYPLSLANNREKQYQWLVNQVDNGLLFRQLIQGKDQIGEMVNYYKRLLTDQQERFIRLPVDAELIGHQLSVETQELLDMFREVKNHDSTEYLELIKIHGVLDDKREWFITKTEDRARIACIHEYNLLINESIEPYIVEDHGINHCRICRLQIADLDLDAFEGYDENNAPKQVRQGTLADDIPEEVQIESMADNPDLESTPDSPIFPKIIIDCTKYLDVDGYRFWACKVLSQLPYVKQGEISLPVFNQALTYYAKFVNVPEFTIVSELSPSQINDVVQSYTAKLTRKRMTEGKQRKMVANFTKLIPQLIGLTNLISRYLLVVVCYISAMELDNPTIIADRTLDKWTPLIKEHIFNHLKMTIIDDHSLLAKNSKTTLKSPILDPPNVSTIKPFIDKQLVRYYQLVVRFLAHDYRRATIETDGFRAISILAELPEIPAPDPKTSPPTRRAQYLSYQMMRLISLLMKQLAEQLREQKEVYDLSSSAVVECPVDPRTYYVNQLLDILIKNINQVIELERVDPNCLKSKCSLPVLHGKLPVKLHQRIEAMDIPDEIKQLLVDNELVNQLYQVSNELHVLDTTVIKLPTYEGHFNALGKVSPIHQTILPTTSRLFTAKAKNVKKVNFTKLVQTNLNDLKSITSIDQTIQQLEEYLVSFFTLHDTTLESSLTSIFKGLVKYDKRTNAIKSSLMHLVNQVNNFKYRPEMSEHILNSVSTNQLVYRTKLIKNYLYLMRYGAEHIGNRMDLEYNMDINDQLNDLTDEDYTDDERAMFRSYLYLLPRDRVEELSTSENDAGLISLMMYWMFLTEMVINLQQVYTIAPIDKPFPNTTSIQSIYQTMVSAPRPFPPSITDNGRLLVKYYYRLLANIIEPLNSSSDTSYQDEQKWTMIHSLDRLKQRIRYLRQLSRDQLIINNIRRDAGLSVSYQLDDIVEPEEPVPEQEVEPTVVAGEIPDAEEPVMTTEIEGELENVNEDSLGDDIDYM